MQTIAFINRWCFYAQSWHAAAWVGIPTHAYPALRAALARISA
jgi:hypothetical protein